MNSPKSPPNSPAANREGGRYSLATIYWTLFLVGAVVFFVSGSMAVAQDDWKRYLILLGANLAWTFILLTGVRVGYRGADPGKALGRVAVLFLLLNITNALATLTFIY